LRDCCVDITDRGFTKYAVEMASCGIICTPSFIKIGSAVQKLFGAGYTYRNTNRQQGDLISLLFLNMRSRLKVVSRPVEVRYTDFQRCFCDNEVKLRFQLMQRGPDIFRWHTHTHRASRQQLPIENIQLPACRPCYLSSVLPDRVSACKPQTLFTEAGTLWLCEQTCVKSTAPIPCFFFSFLTFLSVLFCWFPSDSLFYRYQAWGIAHVFLTSALVGGERSASRPWRFTPGGAHWIRRRVGPRTSLDDVERRKILPLPALELRPLGRPARSQSLYQLWYIYIYIYTLQMENLKKDTNCDSQASMVE
jgi:hypothetical protein